MLEILRIKNSDNFFSFLLLFSLVDIVKKLDTKDGQQAVAKLKHYPNPRTEIIVAMRCVFKLLGNSDEQLRTWKAIKILIKKTGKDKLRTRIVKFEPPTNFTRGKDELVLKELENIDQAAAVFYEWYQGVLKIIPEPLFDVRLWEPEQMTRKTSIHADGSTASAVC